MSAKDSSTVLMKITEALLAEHLVFHNMFDYIERNAGKSKSPAEIKVLSALMETMLDAHSRTEDELFIGHLEHCFEQIGHCETFHLEHKEIERNLKLVQKAKQTRKACQLLLAAVAASRKHFDKEERIVFPLAERVLNSKTLTELGRTWMEQRTRAVL
jgi:hemerythrin-like domain-containing protein